MHNACGGSNSNTIFNKMLTISDNYKLSDSTYQNHILARHGSNSKYANKSHFNKNFDIKGGIESTLKGNKSIIKRNTNGRSGYIIEKKFNKVIGTDTKGKPLYTLKVVIDEFGNVITAFPKK